MPDEASSVAFKCPVGAHLAGYGQQTGIFAPMLSEHYDLAVSSFYGLEGDVMMWNGIRVFPGIGGQYGNESLLAHAEKFFGGNPRNGLVLTLLDVWVLEASKMASLNIASWVPVDHEPAPPRVVEFFIESGAIPIAMSKFGQQMLGRLDPLYVPHGIDTDTYKPLNQEQARGGSFPEGAFVVGIVAANKGRPSRKSFSQSFQAVSRLMAEHENVFLYLHTMLDPNLAGGENIPALLQSLEMPLDRVRIADQYAMTYDPYSAEDMAKIYSAMDVLLNPAMGEGFGIPVLEAQACGVPAVVTDFSAMREVCAAGWHVEYDRYWTGLSSWQAVPRVDDIYSALDECYGMKRAKRQQLSGVARNHALIYKAERVFEEHWLPTMRVVEQRFSKQDPVTIAPRQKAAA